MKIFDKHNIRHQYVAVGVGGVLLAAALFFSTPLAVAAPVGAVLLAAAAVFFETAAKKLKPFEEPPIVRWFDNLKGRIKRHIRPAQEMDVDFLRWMKEKLPNSAWRIFKPWWFLRWFSSDLIEVYDHRGRPQGHIQIIDWNMTSDDPEYRPEEVEIIFTPAKSEEERRLPLIARLRTPGMRVL